MTRGPGPRMAEALADIVVCEPVRTAVGRRHGALAPLGAADLAAAAIAGLVERTGLAATDVDDVILGQCYPNGEAPAIGRVAALDAGLDIRTPGIQIDRRCGSGLQAVLNAAMQVAVGVSDVVIAGGAESMSNSEFYSLGLRGGVRGDRVEFVDRIARGRVTSGGRDHPVAGGMLETAENLRAEYSISRGEQDELAAESQRRAIAAQDGGVFDEEIVPVRVPQRRGDDVVVDTDEHPRRGVTADSLAALRPVRSRVDPDATVTAGNASGENDGAAVCVVTTRGRAAALGLRAYVRPLGWSVTGVHPARMGIGPVSATAELLDTLGLRLADFDLIELNEAFAAQVLACLREWESGFGFTTADRERLNVHGSGISLGHPVGATGTRILTTVCRELARRQGRFALETMCLGGGQGLAAAFERVS
ncbi:acetyl-CoA C-acetyltransferase [Dietzia psychralcaliphila]|uniref:Probable acetyl-CoA acetyltransferase n=1 Tax=Dietzia psychralcaliphila TaxID=139021 RepID=A0AAD0JQG2_9ACTN|nr:acetyl-CoA C-acetyltransferase [Dietzia psychralcaliphila]AWH95872.1 acetyl-CoA acetyltransferase [Dietzia psychralcaliphila]PTM85689.1 acetyl-CoA C-acetyltransferase [Dietzia psychralcaliphila]